MWRYFFFPINSWKSFIRIIYCILILRIEEYLSENCYNTISVLLWRFLLNQNRFDRNVALHYSYNVSDLIKLSSFHIFIRAFLDERIHTRIFVSRVKIDKIEYFRRIIHLTLINNIFSSIKFSSVSVDARA